MALTFGLYRRQRCYLCMLIGNKVLQTVMHNRRWESNYSALLEADNIDDFTTQLMKKKSSNWEIMQAQRRLLKQNLRYLEENLKPKEHKIEVNKLSPQELDQQLRDAFESYNIPLMKSIVTECLECRKLPNIVILSQVLSVYSIEGDKDSILSVIKLCGDLHPSLLKINSDFLHYLAEATWIKGNVNEAITMFEDVYRGNMYLRRKIRCMLKLLILTVVPKRSEATLVALIKFGERIADGFNDFDPLLHLWQICFLSEWYSDQCLAFDLLQKYNGLYAIVSNRLTHFVSLALNSHRIEAVYKLLEMLLMLEHKSHYAKILEVLFDYRVFQGDLRGCSEIIQWSVQHNIDLPVAQQQKFVELFLTCKTDMILNTTEKEIYINNGPKYKF